MMLRIGRGVVCASDRMAPGAYGERGLPFRKTFFRSGYALISPIAQKWLTSQH